MREALSAVRDGGFRVAVLQGPMGVGKTRLLQDLADHADVLGAVTLWGGCVAIPGLEDLQAAYSPYLELLRSRPLPPGPRTAAAQWIDEADAVTGVAGLDPVFRRHAAFLDILAGLAATAPVVVIVEDLQLADLSSLALTVFLARNVAPGLLLAITARMSPSRAVEEEAPGPVVEVLDHLRRLPNVEWLEVGPLEDAEVTEILRLGDGGALGEERIATIVRLAEGNPLVAIELRRSEPDVLVPPSAAVQVRRRLSGLSPAARQLIRAAAVAGSSRGGVDAAGLSELCGDLGPDAFTEALRSGLLIPTGDGYGLATAVEREAVYAGIHGAERSDLHRRTARYLQSLPVPAAAGEYAQAAARIAAHWAHTSDASAVVDSSLTAAVAAAAVSAYPEALAHARRALGSWPAGQDDSGHLLAAMTAAEYARWAAEPTVGLAVLTQAERLATGAEAEALLWERIGWFRREIGDAPGAAQAYDRAVSALDGAVSGPVRMRVLAGRAALLLTSLQLTAAGEVCRAALEGADETPTPELASLLNTLGVVRALWENRVDDGLALLERSRSVAVACESEEDVWRYVRNAIFVLENLGRSAAALDIGLSAIERARTGGVIRSLAVLPVVDNVVGMLAVENWQAAIDLGTQALTGGVPAPFEASLRAARAAAYLARGDAEVEEEVLAAKRAALASGDPLLSSRALRIEAEWALRSADFPMARAAIDRGLELVAAVDDPESVIDLVSIAARIEATAPQPDDARLRRFVALVETASTQLEEPGLPEARAEADLGAAEVRRAQRRDTPGDWAGVAAAFRELNRRYPLAYALLREAEALVAARNRAPAVRCLRESLDIARQLGARPLLAQAIELAHRARIDVDGDTDSRPDHAGRRLRAAAAGLTAREIQVLALLTEGLTNRQIARRLGMTEKTASVHVSNLLAKLGVSNRSRAAAVARERRLLEPEP